MQRQTQPGKRIEMSTHRHENRQTDADTETDQTNKHRGTDKGSPSKRHTEKDRDSQLVE